MEKYEVFAQLLTTINTVIEETKDDIFDRTIEALAQNANEKYKALTSGNQSSGGILDFQRVHDVVNVAIRDVNNGEMTGLGTGFQRMKQLAIVMAVIFSKVGDDKKFDYPFISDAPFSEFGENFINNFFAVAPEVFGQSIIMIKELYGPNAVDLLTPFGRRILDKMKTGQIPATFYMNVIEEKADTTGFRRPNPVWLNDNFCDMVSEDLYGDSQADDIERDDKYFGKEEFEGSYSSGNHWNVLERYINNVEDLFYDGWHKYLIEQYGEDWEKYEY